MYPYLSSKWSRWLPDSQHLMIFSDVTVPDALCLDYAIEQWDIVRDASGFYWEQGICGLQNTPDLSFLNWDYVGDWTADFNLAAEASRNSIYVSPQSPNHDPIATFEAAGRVTSVQWSPRADYLMAISEDRLTRQAFTEVWDFSSRNRVMLIPGAGASWSPDERSLHIGRGRDFGYTLSVYDFPGGNKRFDVRLSPDAYVRWKPDESQFLVIQPGIDGDTIDIGDGQTGAISPLVTASAEINITGLDWHPSKNWLLISTRKALLIYDVQNQRIVSSISSESRIFGWSPDGTMFAARHPDGTIGVWRVSLS